MKPLKNSVAVIDYGMGNVGSVQNMISYLGYECCLVSNWKELDSNHNIILPGVGNFKQAMRNIKKREWDKALEYAVFEKEMCVLGICLGMQLLLDYSEEGDCKGLGYIKGKVTKFCDTGLPIPHMGWNTVNYTDQMKDIYEKKDARYYFVHSYYVTCSDRDNVMATTEYGLQFDSAIRKKNVMGVQFHPEKSHIYGMHFLKKYMEMCQCTTIE